MLAPLAGFDEDDGGPPPLRPWWRRPGVLAAIAVLLILALLIGFFALRRNGQAAAPIYTFATVTQGTLNTTVSATGALQSNLYDVTFQGTGTITAIDVTIGQSVQAGQVLAQMDPTSLRDALTQAQSQYQLAQAGINSAQIAVQNAQSGVASAQTALDNANTNLNHVRSQTNAQLTVAADQEAVALNACDNPPAGTTSPPECEDQARNTYNLAVAQANAQIATAQGAVNSAAAALTSAQGQVNSANSQVQSTQSSAQGSLLAVQIAQTNLNDATIRAPRAGMIVAINGTVGGAPGASGAAGSNAFFQIADLSQLQVMASVNEADIGTIAPGQTVSFTVSAYRNRTFAGKIMEIAPLGVTTQSVVTYPVQIDVDATRLQGANLYPGMTANVTITTASRPKSVLVPASALTFAQAAGPAGSFKLLSCDQVVQATTDALRQLRTILQANPGLASDNPQPGYVVERAANGQFIAVPVVLGLTNGQNDVIVQGLQTNDRIVIGRTNTGATSATTSRPAFPFGGGRFGQGGNPGTGNPSGTPVTGRGGNPGTGQGVGGNLRALLCGTSA